MSGKKKKFLHILNPYTVNPNQHDHFIQQLTFQSLRNACMFTGPYPAVVLASAQFEEDRGYIPPYFVPTKDLQRSIQDYSNTQISKKLPLLADILNRAHDEFDVAYVIYTNVDIAVQPHFYRALAALTAASPGSCTITRRTLQRSYQRIEDLPAMYLDRGEPHRGWDCFVLPRKLIPELCLEKICIGAPLVGLALYANLLALDNNFNEYRRLQLTFHLGNERSWGKLKNSAYFRYNQGQLQQVLATLENRFGAFPPGSPPGKYLRFHRSAWLGRLYDFVTRSIYIPARYTRRTG